MVIALFIKFIFCVLVASICGFCGYFIVDFYWYYQRDNLILGVLMGLGFLVFGIGIFFEGICL